MVRKGREGRCFVRANFPCKIIIYTPEEQAIVTQTENISVGGIMVVIERELKISLSVDMEIYFSGIPLKCKGRVAWILPKESPKPDEIKKYDTGIEFYRITSAGRDAIAKIIDTIISKEK